MAAQGYPPRRGRVKPVPDLDLLGFAARRKGRFPVPSLEISFDFVVVARDLRAMPLRLILIL